MRTRLMMQNLIGAAAILVLGSTILSAQTAPSWTPISGNEHNMIVYGSVVRNGTVLSGTGYYLGSYGPGGIAADCRSVSPIDATGGFYATVLGNAAGDEIRYVIWDGNTSASYAADEISGFEIDGLTAGFVVHFTQTGTTHTISGRVTLNGTGLGGVAFADLPGNPVTNAQGDYSATVNAGWTGTATPSLAGHEFIPANRTYTNVTVNQTDQDYAGAIVQAPAIGLNRTHLNFGAAIGGVSTRGQQVVVGNAGGGRLDWTAASGASWLVVTPASGTNAGAVMVSLNPAGLSAGTYTSLVTFTAPGAANSPRTVDVTLRVFPQSAATAPFGVIDTPTTGATVYGAIPVTGWALDDIEVVRVEIKRDLHAADPPAAAGSDGLVTIGDAVFVEGARPDVETAYPQHPLDYRGGWGYMMLTNMLPNQGNGPFTIHAFAYDKEGKRVNLGRKMMTGDNAGSKKPFGTIDTPAQGGTISGAAYNNFGWALTPSPQMIPVNGSTIRVWVDGVPLGPPSYNHPRSSLAAMFPGLANTNGPVGLYVLDTMALANGVHTIAWSVVDDGGNAEGLGSRFFTVLNTGSAEIGGADPAPGSPVGLRLGGIPGWGASRDRAGLLGAASKSSRPFTVTKGYDMNPRPETVFPDPSGTATLSIPEVERIEFGFGPGAISGGLVVGDELRPLPIGSTLNPVSGVFAWQPGPGFLGEYRLVFVKHTADGPEKREVIVHIRPKF